MLAPLHRRRGQTAMRISVSSWRTTGEDMERSLAIMIRIAHEENRAPRHSIAYPLCASNVKRSKVFSHDQWQASRMIMPEDASRGGIFRHDQPCGVAQ